MLKIKVFGCKTNRYYTDEWLKTEYLQGKSGIFIASCVVTDQAKNKWVRFLLKSSKELGVGEKIFISGCGVLRNGKIDDRFFEVYPELLSLQWKIELLEEDPNESLHKQKPLSIQEKIQSFKQKSSTTFELTRKHLIIQNGCDNFCTFCLTVQARGRHHYRQAETIIQEIREYIQQWGKEMVLTGTNLWAWGAENSNQFATSRFTELIGRILHETTIERLRISSLGVEFCSPELLAYFSNPRIYAYAHLSIQSGSDAILASMGRHYTRETLLRVLKTLASTQRVDGVEVCVGADLIVGFPGETEADFDDTLSLIHEYGVDHVHWFPFSAHLEHYGVPAGKFPQQIEESIKKSRLQQLLSAGEMAKQDFDNRHKNIPLKVLLEGRTTQNHFEWWSQNYIQCSTNTHVKMSKEEHIKNTIITCLSIAPDSEHCSTYK